MLNLTRPLVVFDVETTGITPKVDRITQIAAIKIWPGESIEAALELLTRTIESGESNVVVQDRLICVTMNPECIVKKFVLDLTHLTQDILNASSTFAQWAPWLQHFFCNATNEGVDYGTVDLHGFNNSKFDNLMLYEEFTRCNIDFQLEGRFVIDSHQIYVKKEPRTLAAAHKYYCGEDLEGAHNALIDIKATLNVLDKQLQMYSDIPQTVPELDRYCLQDNWIDRTGKFVINGDDVVMGFGKHSGVPLKQVAQTQSGFLKWMLGVDMPEDAKKIAQDALNGIYPIIKRNI